jgi:AcrR family transcriptional regulator
MVKKAGSTPRREESLSRDKIIEAAVALLDGSGESGLTFRALAERLATGPGAIYWHVANKSDLLTAACDAIVAQTLDAPSAQTSPKDIIRALALGLFDAIDAHPWIGTALTRAPGQLPTVRILERIGQQVRAMGVPGDAQWATVSALLSYILGVSAQNAANAHIGRERGVDRSDFLEQVSGMWLRLDPDAYPFTRSVAKRLPTHDDRVDFLHGIDLILSGLA